MANLLKDRKYHFIYKTTNLLNGKYYIGMHCTNNLKDGYLGSGKRIRYSIKKYGKENFKIEYLEFFDTREQLIAKEKEVVNLQEIAKKDCMNIREGGTGGFTREEAIKGSIKTNKALIKKYGSISNFWKQYRGKLTDSELDCLKQKQIDGLHSFYKNGGIGSFTNKTHTNKTKKKIASKLALIQKGTNNSQYDTMWITNGYTNLKIRKTDIMPEGWRNGRKV